jgi:hypothetical protein
VATFEHAVKKHGGHSRDSADNKENKAMLIYFGLAFYWLK